MLNTAEQVRDYLTGELATGALGVGQKLPTERELASRFQVSRTVVRDALVLLEAESRIVRQVGRGTFVAPLSLGAGGPARGTETPLASPSALLEARSVIEGELAALAVLNATVQDLEALDAACRATATAATPADFERLDSAFHRAIAAATHKPVLMAADEVVESARDNPEWRKLKVQRHLARPSRRAEVQEEHQRVVAAIEKRDAAGARRHMLAHLNAVRINLLGR